MPRLGSTLALLPVTVLALVAASGAPALAQVGVPIVPGVLSISGTGVDVAVSGAPGSLTSSVGGTTLVVTDTTGTTNGWAVTATWSGIAGTKDVGGANVLASVSAVVPDLAGGVLSSAVTRVTNAPLTSPVTVATTGTNGGSGITTMTASYKVRLPVTAQVGNVFGGRVTYTVASVR